MLNNVFFKSLRDDRWPMVWWASGLGLLAATIMAFFPSIRGNDDINAVLESYPENLMALFGSCVFKLTMVREAKSEGRTVFLSSHFLPEVEQLADRVGIIREGRLAAVEEIDSLKARAILPFTETSRARTS